MIPKISVVVPVYNVEKYLSDCLDSILNQSFRDCEVICVDDGSTDSSSDILKKYKCVDTRIKVVRQKNGGLSAARNTGIDNAIGLYICFVDSDDLLTDDALQKLWDAVEKDKPEMVGYETAPLLYENEELRSKENKDEYYIVRNNYPGIRPGREFFSELVKNHDFVESAWLMLIDLKWLKEKNYRFCEGMLYEDSVFAIQCYFACNRMKHIKEQLYVYRIRENSIMTEKFMFKHIYSRLWQYIECLNAVFTLASNEDEQEALSIYAEQSLASIKYIAGSLDEEELDKVNKLGSVYGLIAKSMSITSACVCCNNELLLIGLVSKIKEYKSVILYGAGLIGNKLRRYLIIEKLDHKILGFAVSGNPDNPSVNGIQVKNIKSYMCTSDTLIIISARENFHKDMVDNARKLGFENINVIDYAMEYVIDDKLQQYDK